MLIQWHKYIIFVLMGLILVITIVPTKLDLGMAYSRSFLYEKAYQTLSSLLKKDKDNITALKYLADYQITIGDLDKASELYKTLNRLRPKNRYFINKLAELYDWGLDPYMKQKTLEMLLDVPAAAYEADLPIKLFQGYLWLKKPDDAARMAGVIEKQGHDASTMLMLTDYYIRFNKKDDALRLLNTYLADKPSASLYREKIAELYSYEGNVDKAVSEYVRLMSGKYMKQEEIAKVAYLDTPEKLNPYTLDLLDKINRVYITNYKYGDAVKLQEKVCGILKTSTQCYKDLIYYYNLAKTTDYEIAALEKIIEISNSRSEIVSTYIELAGKLELSHNEELAVDNLKKALMIDHNNIQAMKNLSYLYYKLNDLNSFTKYIKKILEIDPENVEALKEFVQHLEDTGDYNDALIYQKKLFNIVKSANAARKNGPDG